ncbi:MAG: helix-turn-helix domain-containing protein [Proteobacteria bacterium]|nr:helix-turn-helix domain-containing protein [Pseudomonadota bacterium]
MAANKVKHRSTCPIARSLDVLGDKWTLVIMRDALFFDRYTFADFEHSGEKIPTNMLANRLKKLVDLGLLKKVLYQQHPDRYRYEPTEMGTEIKPVLKSLARFGEKHLGGRIPL